VYGVFINDEIGGGRHLEQRGCVAPDYTKARACPRRVLVAQHQASVSTRPSTPEGERARWNVWDMTDAKGRRLELELWAMDVLAPQAAASVDPKSSMSSVESTA
jgi:hypothetical protein